VYCFKGRFSHGHCQYEQILRVETRSDRAGIGANDQLRLWSHPRNLPAVFLRVKRKADHVVFGPRRAGCFQHVSHVRRKFLLAETGAFLSLPTPGLD
jgi:hypothetical protein